MQENTVLEGSASSQPIAHAVMIANPVAGSYVHNRQRLQNIIERLRAAGWQAELQLTTCAGDARRLAREAVAAGSDVVIAVGGDGTINEVIQELAHSECALGVIPSGTVNVWAREISIPLDCEKACEVLLQGHIRRMDLGRVNERYFLLMAGVGMDGEITHTVERKSLKRLGVLGYALVTLWLGFGYRGFRTRLTFGDGRVLKARALEVLVGNTRLYAGATSFTWEALCDDGRLDVCVVRERNALTRLVMALDFLLRRKQRRQWVYYETCTHVTVETPQPIPIQIDGDAAGYTPATFSVAPGALKVVVPDGVETELFSQNLA